MPFSWLVPNLLTGLRMALVPVLWALALLGEGRLVGVGLVLAGATDFLDGHLAHRFGHQSNLGARLDSLADTFIMLSAALWLDILHPEILRGSFALVVATLGVYVISMSAGLLRFRTLGNLHLYSSKVAGGFLYGFAVITLVTGSYTPALLWLAAGSLIVSSSETFFAQLVAGTADENMGSLFLARRRRAEATTVHDIWIAKKQRSQAPQ